MERYHRHIIMPEIGLNGQEKLSRARVLVIGAGGLGCPVLQYLAAAGIGTLGIIDFDMVERSNLQRQVLFGDSTLGKNKALAAKERLSDLNQEITINAYPERLTPGNALEHFKDYDIIVDGSDNFGTRYLVNDACVLSGKPFVYGAIYKFEGQVAVFNYNGGPTYRCLFPLPPRSGSNIDCNSIGVLGVLPGIIGTMQANEVLKIVLGSEQLLSGQMLCYDSRSATTYKIGISAREDEIKRVKVGGLDVNNPIYEDKCIISAPEVTAEEAFDFSDAIYYDLRESHEVPKLELTDYSSIPMSRLHDNIELFRNNKPKILICQSGVRSLNAVGILTQAGITNCYSLKGGVISLNQKTKSTYEG